MIYSPAEDSYLLEAQVKKLSKGKTVLDMGCGSGILSLAAKNSGGKYVLGADINFEAVAETSKKGIDAVKSNLFQKIKGKFDLVVFNPPYLPKDEREDSESSQVTSGGKNGDEIIIRFLKNSTEHLSPNGKILILVSSLTPREKIDKLLVKLKLSRKVLSEKKLFMEKLEVWQLQQNLKVSRS